MFITFFVISLILKKDFNLLPFFISSFIVFASGLYDDFIGLSAQKKLLLQLIAVLSLSCFGILITDIRLPFVTFSNLGILSLPVTILWFMLLTNLINIADGLDGLATGIYTLTLFVIWVWLPPSSISSQILISLGLTVAFLLFNFYPAKIFLGNSGSLFLGFSLAYFSIVARQESTATFFLLIPITLLLIHVIDMLYAVYRRRKQGVSIFKGDKTHLHYLLLGKIVDHRKTVLLFYLATLILAFFLMLGLSVF